MSLADGIRALEQENAKLKQQIADLPESTTVLLALVQKLEDENRALKTAIQVQKNYIDALAKRKQAAAAPSAWDHNGVRCTCDDGDYSRGCPVSGH